MIESIEQIYQKLKDDSGLPIAALMYITFDGKKYECGNTILVDFHRDKESIENMKNVSNTIEFYAFFHSDKGRMFFEENKKQISKAYTNIILGNAGYGTKIGKN